MELLILFCFLISIGSLGIHSFKTLYGATLTVHSITVKLVCNVLYSCVPLTNSEY